MTRDELLERANAVEWYHGGMYLGHDIVTAGKTEPRSTLLPYLQLPDDLTGKSVIDICTWDGFMAFECERRGAEEVYAVDSFAWDKRNSALTGHTTGRDGFNLAHKARQSNVNPFACEVLDLNVYELNTFDIVLFLGVIYHMRHPLLALEQVASLASDLLIVESYVDMTSTLAPAMRFYPGNEVNNDSTNWWGPNTACLEAMLHDVGFAHVESFPGAGSNRAVVHARRKVSA